MAGWMRPLKKKRGELSAEVPLRAKYNQPGRAVVGDGFQEKGFYTFAGPQARLRACGMNFASKYGNVYLRKLD